jgi:hypothetical protein
VNGRTASIIAAIAIATAAVVSTLSGCGAIRPLTYTCATDTLPPVAVDPIVCHNGLPAVRWFSAFEGSPPAVPGFPLDYSWWHGGTGTIGYGRGYDPRPAGSYAWSSRYAPPGPAVVFVPVEPPAARSVSTPPTATKAAGKQQADPPKATPKATPKPRTGNR